MIKDFRNTVKEFLGVKSKTDEMLKIGEAVHEGFMKGFEEGTKRDKDTKRKSNDLYYGGDTRYKTPKEKHKASEEEIDHVLATTPIYQRANERLNKAQRGQIGYGIDKYPNPLNADTWTIFETLDHMRDESIDKMHYEEMLREKFEQMTNELEELRELRKISETTGLHDLVLEVSELRKFKRSVELSQYKESSERTLYSDEFLYPLTYIGGADHDGDVVYPKSDVNHYKENNDEESTYIKNCKKATEASEEIRKLANIIQAALKKGVM